MISQFLLIIFSIVAFTIVRVVQNRGNEEQIFTSRIKITL